jgi:hypothetical protein
MSSFKSMLGKYSRHREETPADSSPDERERKQVPAKPPVHHEQEVILASTSKGGDFARIGRTHRTDKVTHHGYFRYYPRFLESYRSLSSQYGMLEIGIDQCRSLSTWQEYFPNLFIYGMDIGVSDEGPRHKIFQCNQSDHQQVEALVKNSISHDICFIIDDGSHIPEHQISCFDYLFDALLLPGGTYIIEDIETSYWTTGGLYGYQTRYGYGHKNSIIEVMKILLDEVNREFLLPENVGAITSRLHGLISEATRQLVSTVTFGQNCVIITKKTKEEMEDFNGRDYRFKDNL